MLFKGFMCISMQNARFQLMRKVDAKLCSHLIFQISFQNTERQKYYRNCFSDPLEL